MLGILCEKPSAAKNFAKAFDVKYSSKENCYKGKYKGQDILIVNSVGHIFSYVEPEKMAPKELAKKYSSWTLSNLPWNYEDFTWKRQLDPKKKDINKNIKTNLSKCDEIIIATDIDESGEGMLLAAEILIENKLTKSKKLTRMEFTDEEPQSLQKAFANRYEIKDLYKNKEYIKSIFRSRFDYLTMQSTREFTYFSPIPKSVIRTGRLKGVMIDITGDALNLLSKHKTVYYYQNRFKDENGIIYTDPKEKKYDKPEEVPQLYKPSKVNLIKKEIKYTAPPILMDMAKLSAKLAPRGYKPKSVLQTYQSMYVDGVVSYPRTSDKNITAEQFNALLPQVDKIANLIGVNPSILKVRQPRKTHVFNSGSHGANRPGPNVPNSLTAIENKYGKLGKAIYILLAKSFLAMFAEDYQYEKQTGNLVDYPTFTGSINIPIKWGWKEVYGADFEDDCKEELSKVGLGRLAKPFIFKGEPPKPPVPTMSWLMKQLEKYDVGTGATRTSTFSEITSETTKWPLMTNTKGKITLTSYGEIAWKLGKNTNINNIKTTEDIYKIMKNIDNSRNEDSNRALESLQSVANIVLEDMKILEENASRLHKDDFKQTKKEFKVVEKQETTDDAGNKVTFKKEWGGHKFTEEELSELSKGNTITLKNLKGKKGNYSVKGKLEWQSFKGKKFYGFKVIEWL